MSPHPSLPGEPHQAGNPYSAGWAQLIGAAVSSSQIILTASQCPDILLIDLNSPTEKII